MWFTKNIERHAPEVEALLVNAELVKTGLDLWQDLSSVTWSTIA